MNLVIDIGNTLVKYGVFEGKELKEHGELTEAELENVLSIYINANKIVSSVRKENAIDGIDRLTYETPLPISIEYGTPNTLGVDRIAAACGASSLYPKQNCLIIDLGTCITIDFLSIVGTFKGGVISPGMKMRWKAMHHFTGKLPLANLDEEVKHEAQSTNQALYSGVILGIIGELNSAIEYYQGKYADCKVILCGGDATYFESKLKQSIFAQPFLLLHGLNAICEYNNE